VFLDESGFMLQPVNRRTWAPRGRTPVQYAWDRHDRISAIAALEYRPRSGRVGLHCALQPRNVNAEDLVAYLRQLRRDLRRPLILVCDRWSVHRSAITQLQAGGASWLEVEWLPPYAPDLNPAEGVWNHAKYVDLNNYVPDDRDDLGDRVAESLTIQHYRSPLLHSFLARAGLKL